MFVLMIMMMTVRVGMVMMRMVPIRARAIRLERRGERRQLRGGAGEQRLDLSIRAQAQPVGEDLRGHVPVTELPRDASERRRISNACLDQRFRIRHDVDQAAVIEHQRIVGGERRRLGEIELDAGAFAGEEETLLGLALVETEDERVSGTGGPRLARSQDIGGARHR
ncbi:MAG TPA: hypothetical protein VGG01_00710 [Xanthobacteraceae bacterium]